MTEIERQNALAIPEDRAKKLLQVKQLTDPLGAMGFRHPRARLEREARVRRIAFVAALASFFGIFGAIAFGADRPPAAADPQPTVTADRIVRQYIVRDANGDTTLVRILAPPAPAAQPKPHVRTRSS